MFIFQILIKKFYSKKINLLLLKKDCKLFLVMI